MNMNAETHDKILAKGIQESTQKTIHHDKEMVQCT